MEDLLDFGKLRRRVGYGVFGFIERLMRKHSLVHDETFFDDGRFPWVREVEARYPMIRAELERVLQDRDDIPALEQISPYQDRITNDGRWKVFYLYGWGNEADENCKRCPETALAVRKIPGMTSAFFSILEPGKRIPEHRGPYAGVLRYHLGAVVPEQPEKCGIYVGGDIRHWYEGRSLIFDDTYTHRAWNDTGEVRVVLFVDFMRPLPALLHLVNRAVLYLVGRSPQVKRAKRKLTEWGRTVAPN